MWCATSWGDHPGTCTFAYTLAQVHSYIYKLIPNNIGEISMSSKDIFVKTPIIWRARGTDYNIDHIVSVRPWWNVVTKTNGIKVRLVNGDFDVICFAKDYVDPDNHKDYINEDAKECWYKWCEIVGMDPEVSWNNTKNKYDN